jgi:hypothetical protein
MKPAAMLASDVDPSFAPLEPPPAAPARSERPPFPTTLKAYATAKFRWIFDQISLDTDLTPFQVCVALRIAKHHDRLKGYAHPKHSTMAKELGAQGTRGVKAAIDVLVARGHLQIEYSRGAGTANRYFLILKRRLKAGHFPADEASQTYNGHVPF